MKTCVVKIGPDDLEERALVVLGGLVALDEGQAERLHNGADVPMLEVDRWPRAPNQLAEGSVAFRFDDSATRKFDLKHVHIVSNNQLDLPFRPGPARSRRHTVDS